MLLRKKKLQCVCQRWKIIQQHLFIKQKSLQLMFNDNSIESDDEYYFHGLQTIGKHTLKINKLTKPVVYKLINIFPNITSLEITTNLCANEMVCEILLLMLDPDESFWPKQLVQLAWFDDSNYNDNPKIIKNFKTLFNQINYKFPLLRQLIFATVNLTLSDIDFSIINQLEILYIQTLDFDELSDSFQNCIKSENSLTKIGFGVIYDVNQLMNVTRYCSNAVNELDMICVDEIHLIDMIKPLAQFRNLTKLQLSISNQFEHQFSEFDSLSVENVPILNNLQYLILDIEVKSHNAMESQHLKRIFPKLENLTIRYYMFPCVSCPQVWSRFSSSRSYCKSLLLRPWKQCTSIKHFFKYSVKYPFFD